MSEYRRGQEVEVSYRARVAEVYSGSLAETPLALRLEPIDGSYASPPGGWVNPAVVNVKVVQTVLPTLPGVYWAEGSPATQEEMGAWHTNGREYYLLNTNGLWCDLGWGGPSHDAVLHGPLVQAGPDLTPGS